MHRPSSPDPDPESLECRICGSIGAEETVSLQERMFGWGDRFVYFRCRKCDCLQIAELPEDLSRYYPTDYYSFQDRPDQGEGGVRRLVRRMRDRAALERESWFRRALLGRFGRPELEALSPLGLTSTTRILDVGSGTGRLLYSLREMGFENLLGVDPFLTDTLSYDNGLEIRRAGIEEVDGSWDVVMLHHTLEHLVDPLQVLREVRQLLVPGGTCLVRIPVFPCWAWEHYGAHWIQLDAPRHITLHSIRSLTILAENAGLQVGEVVFDSTEFQFWGSEQYRQGIPLQSPESYLINRAASPFSRADIRRFRLRASELNRAGRGDQAAFYLRVPA